MKQKAYIYLIVFALAVLTAVFIFVPSATIGVKYAKELQTINKVTFKDQRRGAPIVFTDEDKVEKMIGFISNYRIALALPETGSGWLYNVAFCTDESSVINIYYSGIFTINGVAYRIANGYSQEIFDSFIQSLIDN